MLSNVIRWSGLAALLGGVLIVAYAVIVASMPRGCIGDECAFWQMRDTGSADALLLFGLLFVAAGAVGLMLRLREIGRFGWLGRSGGIVGAVGFVLLVLAGVTGAITDGMSPLMPVFVVPGLLAVIAGLLLLGVAVLRTRVLPLWVDLLLIVSLLAMVGFNDQNWRALMAVPFGVAWVVVGYVLWSEKRAPARQPAGVR